MRPASQRGMLLLPLTLVLVVVGALAFAMTREGSMNVAAVDAEYDTENARYLAEAGLALARWQNEKLGCRSKTSPGVGFGTVVLPGGTITAQDSDINWYDKNTLNINLVATTNRGAVNTLSIVGSTATQMHNFAKISQTTITPGGGNDTFIQKGLANPGGTSYLEITDDTSNALLNFPVQGLSNAVVLKAELSMTQISSLSTQPVQSLSVYRATTAWAADRATWTSATSTSNWNTAGGDYFPNPVATQPINGNAQYVWRIDGLVDGWTSGRLANQGILLKSSGMLQARFGSFENGANNPQLAVRYVPSC